VDAAFLKGRERAYLSNSKIGLTPVLLGAAVVAVVGFAVAGGRAVGAGGCFVNCGTNVPAPATGVGAATGGAAPGVAAPGGATLGVGGVAATSVAAGGGCVGSAGAVVAGGATVATGAVA